MFSHKKVSVNIGIALILTLSAILGLTFFPHSNATLTQNSNFEGAGTLASASSVGTAGYEGLVNVPVMDNSWPGEIISSDVAQIQPQREGVITNWNVRIGDVVQEGDVLGKISAPPATPELVVMLAEKAEGLARARAQARASDEFAVKEQKRFDAMNDALGNKAASNVNLSLAILNSMRETVVVRHDILRSFVERALARHVVLLSSFFDWRQFRFGGLNKQYGSLNRNMQNAYEVSLVTLIQKLKDSFELPIAEAQNYFSLLAQLANNSSTSDLDSESVNDFKMSSVDDQKEFLDLLGEYRMAQAELADKETEYKLMISEQGAMIAKERSMAHAEVYAMETSYNTIAQEINNELNIIAPRTGTVSAIYRKVGDLVGPEMSIAVIAGYGDDGLIARIQIPSNMRKPQKGELFMIVRSGFPNDERRAKIIGVGSSLDEMGSYMADAVFVDQIDWPIGASVRVIVPQNAIAPSVKLSSVQRNNDGSSYVWGVSDAGRIFAKQIKIGRTLGSLIEVYEGLKRGDRYIVDPTSSIREDMLVDEIIKIEKSLDGDASGSTKSGGHDSMSEM